MENLIEFSNKITSLKEFTSTLPFKPLSVYIDSWNYQEVHMGEVDFTKTFKEYQTGVRYTREEGEFPYKHFVTIGHTTFYCISKEKVLS